MPRTILLADDSATIRRVVELSLSGTRYRVETVDNGAAALERLERLAPDLVIADVAMAEPSGYEICRRIKSSSRPVPVLLVATSFEAFDPELARRHGADGYMIKPFESRTLVEKIEEVLQSGGAARPFGDDAPATEAEPLSATDLDRLTEAVAKRLTFDVVRNIAREVVPRVAERVVRERIRELEKEAAEPARPSREDRRT